MDELHRSQRESRAENEACEEAPEMREHVGVGADAEEHKNEQARAHAAENVAGSFRAGAKEVDGMNGEHAERPHHHAGSAETGVRPRIKREAEEIAHSAR